MIPMSLPFHMVDVFAEAKLQGNQLAVVRDRRGIPSELMQRIAKEVNFSETTFITAEDPEKLVFRVRIFTPESELPFAGHPTLGTAYVIQQTILGKPVERLTLEMKAGMIPVTFTYRGGEPEILWMRQLNPVFGAIHEPGPVAAFLGLKRGDIDAGYPVQEVSTGVPFFIVPLRSRDTVKRVQLNVEKLRSYTATTQAKWPLVFCGEPEDPRNQLKARMITTFTEDPATGSANGCLAGYLVKHRYFGKPVIDVRVEQGAEVSRPSLLYLRAEEKGPGAVEVNVGGRCAMVARGEFV